MTMMRANGQQLACEEGITKLLMVKLKSKSWYSAEECLPIVAELRNSEISASAKEELVQIVLSRSEGTIPKPKSGRPRINPEDFATMKQSHLFLENYFTVKDWQAMSTISKMAQPDYRAAGGLIVRAMLRCGWLKVAEVDWKIPLSFLALSARLECMGSAGTGTKNFLVKLHAALKKHLPDHVKQSSLPMMYPECPTDLLEPWLSYSQTDGPLALCPPAQATALQDLRAAIPTRNTHWTCKMEAKNPIALEPRPLQAHLAIDWCPPTKAFGSEEVAEPATPGVSMRVAKPAVLGMQPTMQARGENLASSPRIVEVGAEPAVFGMQLTMQARGENLASSPRIVEVGSDTSPDPKAEEATTPQAEPKEAGEALPKETTATAPTIAPGSSLAVLGPTRAGPAVPLPSMLGKPKTEASATRPGLAAMISASAALLGGKSLQLPVQGDSASEESGSASPRRKRTRKSSSGAAARTSGKTKAKKTPASARAKKSMTKASAPAKKAAAPAKKTSAPAKKAAAPAKKTSAPAKDDTKKAAASKDPGGFRFPGTKKHDPVFYGRSTVYIDAGNQMWRIKAATGDRVMVNRSFKAEDPRKVWQHVVKELKRLNA
jgi:hypothetical protein